MPRSGTTLVEQIISSHSQITGAGELAYAKKFGAKIITKTGGLPLTIVGTNNPKAIKYNEYSYLIIWIGLNTNIAPQNKNFKSTCLKNIVNKKISNQKVLKNIIKAYEKLLYQTKAMSFGKLKRKYL